MKRRNANLILVALGAVGGGVIIYSAPSVLLERGVTASGLPTILPMAAPPLGTTAHMLLAAAGALLCALLAALCLPWRGKKKIARGQEGGLMTFLLSRLGILTRGGRRPGERTSLEYHPGLEELDSAPVLHRLDAHPDAPPRPPLFARRDLGDAVLPPIDAEAGDWIEAEDRTPEPVIRDITGFSVPRAPEPLPWDLIEQEMSRVLKGVHVHGVEKDGVEELSAIDAPEPSIGDLAERLEKGLARRRARLAGTIGHAPYRMEAASVSNEERADSPGFETRLDISRPGDADPQTGKLDEELERALAALRGIIRQAG